ncbi:hypothetical protein [Spirosoma sp. KNUC1025]|uniref:hypothetical protein n=1 Tax=Spirosoma sp. KNUC1025 TaxID=2894082 RepID=UPI003862EB81|nr:hypothetical protein LN737_20360 [Spirosoma sp. KNUC1025]
MNKKLTTVLGIALGASLVAGFGIYKYFSSKGKKAKSQEGGSHVGNGLTGGFLGKGLIKSYNLTGGDSSIFGNGIIAGGHVGNGLVGGGLYNALSGHGVGHA